MQLTLVTASLILAIFSFVVVAGHVLATDSAAQQSSRLLAAFLLATAATLANFLLFASGAVRLWPAPAYLGNTIGLCAAPLLFVYARSLSEPAFRARPVMLWHFAPVGVFLAAVVFGYTVKPRAEQLAILSDPAQPSLINAPLLQVAVFAFVFFYLLKTIFLLSRHKARFRQAYSTAGPGELAWLRIAVTGAAIVWTGSLAHQIIIAMWPVSWLDTLLTSLLAGSAFGFGFYFLIRALQQVGHTPLPGPASSNGKYGHHRLSEDAVSRFAEALEAHLDKTKPHLTSTLAIDDLAGDLPMTARELSQTINRRYRRTFFEFVNDRRIAHAMTLLKCRPDAPVTEIMGECGFTSKSSFYAEFRKRAGKTPSEYRRSARETGDKGRAARFDPGATEFDSA